MILGDFVFSIKTVSPGTFTRTTEYNWAGKPRVGDIPYAQNLGVSKDEVDLDGVFYPKFIEKVFGYVPPGSIRINKGKNLIPDNFVKSHKLLSYYDGIEDIRSSGLCQTSSNLIDDNGVIIGQFVIVSIKETQSFFGVDGSPQKIEFSMKLKRVPKENYNVIKNDVRVVNTRLNVTYLKTSEGFRA